MESIGGHFFLGGCASALHWPHIDRVKLPRSKLKYDTESESISKNSKFPWSPPSKLKCKFTPFNYFLCLCEGKWRYEKRTKEKWNESHFAPKQPARSVLKHNFHSAKPIARIGTKRALPLPRIKSSCPYFPHFVFVTNVIATISNFRSKFRRIPIETNNPQSHSLFILATKKGIMVSMTCVSGLAFNLTSSNH